MKQLSKDDIVVGSMQIQKLSTNGNKFTIRARGWRDCGTNHYINGLEESHLRDLQMALQEYFKKDK